MKTQSQNNSTLSIKEKRRKMFLETPMWKLLLKMCLPGVIIMSIMGIYNFSDNILAINFAYDSYLDIVGTTQNAKRIVKVIMASIMPMMNISLALVMMITVGVSTRVSINLGRGDIDRARNTIKTGMMIGMGIMIITTPIIIAVSKSWIATQLPDMPDPRMVNLIQDEGFKYSTIILCFQGVFFFNNMISSLLRTEGRMKEATLAMFIPVIFNLLADYLLMGPGKMSIEGAATATAIADVITTIVLVICIVRVKESNIRFKNLFGFKFAAISLVGILLVGMAPFFRNAAQSITGTAQMNIIADITQHLYPKQPAYMTFILTSAFPIFGLFFPMLFGIVQGAAPVASYNYGAGETKRVKKAVFWSFIYTLILGVIVWLLASVVLINPLLEALGVEHDRDKIKVVIMILMLGAPLFAIAIAGMVLFSSTDRVAFSFISSTCRGFILFFPVIYIFKAIAIANPQYDDAFWWMFPTLSFASGAVIGLMMIITMRKLEQRHTTLDERIEIVDKTIMSFIEVIKVNRKSKKALKEKYKTDKASGKYSKKELDEKHAQDLKELKLEIIQNKKDKKLENKLFKQEIKKQKDLEYKQFKKDKKLLKNNKK
ncbi:MAG: polysaccharide biosynthesis C-terminal domain-containing protein [Mycoplasmatales bacterium]|nr:polysaccharide biosynthesis C-terminal domain-containing protein [Mycoplasmatales bacterium]